jgi:hypothetical protein
MARGDRATATAEPEVETVDATGDETETVSETSTETKAKPKAEPARGDLPEGYVTPIGLAKALSQPIDGNAENTDPSNFYHTDRSGGHEVRPQMVYSYMKNAPKDHPFPIETVTDSIGKERQALKLDAGLAWWVAKNERVAGRRQNAAEKAAKKAANAKSGDTSTTEAEGDQPEVSDAE